MNVVCKMQCNAVPQGDSITDDVQTVALGAVYEQDEGKRALSENAIFGKYTPWGEIKMGIANADAKRFFTPGKKYYVTFTDAPD